MPGPPHVCILVVKSIRISVPCLVHRYVGCYVIGQTVKFLEQTSANGPVRGGFCWTPHFPGMQQYRWISNDCILGFIVNIIWHISCHLHKVLVICSFWSMLELKGVHFLDSWPPLPRLAGTHGLASPISLEGRHPGRVLWRRLEPASPTWTRKSNLDPQVLGLVIPN